jgi:Tat protein translocase TatC
MLKWLFSKVIKIREKVSSDLGQQDVEKPFLEHLEDLRTMLVRIAGTLAIFVIGTFIFYDRLWGIITYPVHLAGLEGKITFTQLNPIGGFMAIMNLSIVGGIVLSCPLLLYFLMQFVLPGLKTTEKKIMFPALAVGAGLFLLGASFSYFVVVPKALDFFFHFNTQLSNQTGGGKVSDATMWGIQEYTKFICQFILIFGLCFELPVVVMALVKLDILSYKVMKTTRSWAAVGICVVSAVIAPSPDVFTLGLISVPLYLLYEICIWLAWWLDKRDRKLYPEHYQAIEDDAQAIETTDEWDNESYNPWNNDDDEDELRPAARPAPSGTQPMSDAHSDTPTETIHDHPPLESDPKPDDTKETPAP